MKKLFSIISAALALCTLAITAGCTGGQPSKTDSSDQGSVSETPKDTVAPAKADTSITEAEVKTDAPTTTEAVADYRNPFINALLESPDQWFYNNKTYSKAAFFDLDNDGKNEFLVWQGGGSSHMINTKIFYWDGSSVQESTGEGDPNYDKYGYYLNPATFTYYRSNETGSSFITGTMGIANGIFYSWGGTHTLTYTDKKVSIEYKYAKSQKREPGSDGEYSVECTYYDGASHYANSDNANVITEEEFINLQDSLTANCDKLDLTTEEIDLNKWEGLSDSQKRSDLEDSYDAFKT